MRTPCRPTLDAPPPPTPLASLPRQLIRLGACIDAPALSRATPLHLAVQAGQLHAARLLVSKSANLEARDWFGKTALHHACDYARMNGLDNNAACFLIEAGANVHIWDFCRFVDIRVVVALTWVCLVVGIVSGFVPCH